MNASHKIRLFTNVQNVNFPKYFCRRSSSSTLAKNFYNEDQLELQKTTKKLIEKEINPYVDVWEEEKLFPAKTVFKKFGQLGLLGINKVCVGVIHWTMGNEVTYHTCTAIYVFHCHFHHYVHIQPYFILYVY